MCNVSENMLAASASDFSIILRIKDTGAKAEVSPDTNPALFLAARASEATGLHQA